MHSLTKHPTSPTTKNSFEVSTKLPSGSRETFADTEEKLVESSVQTTKLDEMTSVRFLNQTTDPDENNRTGEIAVVKSNIKFCLRGRTPSAAPIFIPAITKPFNFFQSNVAASQSAVALSVLGLTGNTGFVMPFPGSIIGISIASNDARTAGTLTVDVTKNGTVTGLQAVLDGTNTTTHYATQEAEADVFDAGDLIGVKITTDGSWAPTTADIVVTVIVQ